jgi:hypothetical protein
MNRPNNFVTGSHKPHHIAPRILPRGSWKAHLAVFGLRPSPNDEVVMWTDGAVHFAGHEAGVHDGIRDGESHGSTDMRGNFCRYCLLSDWLAAGNPQPEE